MRAIVQTMLLVALLAAPATAQEYPSRPLKLMVPLPAGSSTDAICRSVGDKMAQILGQPLVVENRPGAGGEIAMKALVQSVPDGYTLGCGNYGQMVLIPERKKARKEAPPYSAREDFTSIGLFGRSTFVLVVRSDLGPKTWSEFVQYLRTQPGVLVATGNPIGTRSAEILAGGKKLVTEVPYKGEPHALADVLGGRIGVAFFTAHTALPHLHSGSLIPLGVLGTTRSRSLPDVKTLVEEGATEFGVIAPFNALFGPKGLDERVVHTLNAALQAALKDEAVLATLEKIGLEPWVGEPQDLEALLPY